MPLRYTWPSNLRKLYESGLSTDDVAAAIGHVRDQFGQRHTPTGGGVRKALRALGCPMRSTGVSGEKNGSWKGGRRIDDNGYVWIRRPDHPYAAAHGYVQEHRLVAEQVLGRYLSPEEVVHHEDDNRQNNQPSNLVVYPDNATHMRETRKGKRPNWSKDGYRRIVKHLARFRKAQKAKRDAATKKSSGIRLA